ncbi:magnesium chelatase [Pyrodictium occultum]|uniref:Magnesium chelatase n=1 Tax=Pyrodictium occultum TaxID=2309 RepID=A0A0V8RWZ8_PYROC|nr:magnesium chelatase subunit H [Pyrodictium occultum]KSW12582.1 magnesium chelatase [Pyrodictium occultum]
MGRLKVLLISTVISGDLKRAIKDVSSYVDVKLLYSHQLPSYSREDLQRLVDWADVILIDVRGDPGVLSEIDYKEKDVVYLVGGSPTLMARTKLGRFRMPAKAASIAVSSPESMVAKIKRMERIIESLGRIIPFGALRDARDYVRLVKYWANGGYENYKNMFLLLARRAGARVEVREPIEFQEYGLYHPVHGFNYNPIIDPSKPTVGILFYGGMHFGQCAKTLEELVKRLEEMNINVIPAYTDGILALKPVEKFFTGVDAIISLLWFRLNGGPYGGDPRPTVELLKRLKAKLFTPVMMYNQKIEDWRKSERGLNALTTVTAVTLPEMDGGVEPIPLGGVKGDEVVPIDDRVDKVARRVARWLELRRKPNHEKRIAIIIYNYPPGEENLGNAAYLDTFKSVERILEELRREGYQVPEVKDLKKMFIEKKLFNPTIYPPEKIDCPRMSVKEYLKYFNELPEDVRREVVRYWGEPPGEIMVDDKGILIPGVVLGNVFIGVQPSRPPLAREEDVYHAIHDPTRPPHHQYLAFYFWLQRVFKADAVIHVGTHGTAEFMKGKEVGLSSRCFPDILIGDMPSLYIYHVVNTSEATLAKRRLYATLISYNSPPYTTADLYEDYARLEGYLDEYREALSSGDRARAEIAKRKALELARKLHLGEDLEEVEAKLYEYKRSIIPKGLHVLGQKYSLEELEDFIVLLARYDRGEIKSLNRLICEDKGWSYEEVLKDPRRLREVDREARQIVQKFLKGEKVPARYEKTLRYSLEIAKKYADNSLEIKNLLEGLKGNYIEPSPGGDVIRNPEALPTGRNIYQFDPLKVPTEAATERGRYIARETLRKYFEKHGRYPESVGVVLWGFETAKTYGETVAQIFEYLGVEVIHKSPWEKELRVIPLSELGHPRIDVVVTICGFFREMFPNVMALIDRAVKLVAELDEPEELNFVKKHVKELRGFGSLAKVRIFGPRATEYGTRMLQLVEDSAWKDEADLAEAYMESMSYAYGEGIYSQKARQLFEDLLKRVDMVTQVRDSQDYEITDLDHYYEFFGGLAKSVEQLRGKKPEMLIADTTGEMVKVEDVRESITRGTITRTLNPKWIEAMLKHGFHGAQKIADRVEYLLGLAATTGAVENWVWDKVAERFVLDENLFERIKSSNPYAAKKILERLLEASERGYWKADRKVLKKIKERYMELDAMLEEEA